MVMQVTGVMLRQVRVLRGGVISAADRRIHTTTDESQGGPDQVQWVTMPDDTSTYTIRFDGRLGSPFQAGDQDIPVPSGPLTVTQGRGTYKYAVLNAAGNRTDDPDVIIE